MDATTSYDETAELMRRFNEAFRTHGPGRADRRGHGIREGSRTPGIAGDASVRERRTRRST